MVKRRMWRTYPAQYDGVQIANACDTAANDAASERMSQSAFVPTAAAACERWQNGFISSSELACLVHILRGFHALRLALSADESESRRSFRIRSKAISDRLSETRVFTASAECASFIGMIRGRRAP